MNKYRIKYIMTALICFICYAKTIKGQSSFLKGFSVSASSGNTFMNNQSLNNKILNNIPPENSFSSFSGFKSSQEMKIDSLRNLPTVTVTAPSYHSDSLHYRMEYKDAFNYKRPTLKYGTDWNLLMPFLDIDKLFEVLNKNEIRDHLVTKNLLLFEERNRYIDHRFNKAYITLHFGNIQNIDSFLLQYRPDYFKLISMNEIDLLKYTQESLEKFLNVKTILIKK